MKVNSGPVLLNVDGEIPPASTVRWAQRCPVGKIDSPGIRQTKTSGNLLAVQGQRREFAAKLPVLGFRRPECRAGPVLDIPAR
ncbi:hypothetical protein [Aliiruegeria sabulilitoris]|uniref:hypothetical protein n=1 Tax=Aliiruegeria sabulilitoris TaxID=1510458 RepID=UPI0012E33AFE|nr:hypothetical protein [Aliiruegeria sabulilitoris]NDR59635.1 hypothetical protein [Pseudoruegeria sp. M32A2M]